MRNIHPEGDAMSNFLSNVLIKLEIYCVAHKMMKS
jgi:hypothetical protein